VNCPKCQSAMEVVTTESGAVDRCTACGGMWFDRLEVGKQAAFAAVVDTGDAARGARYNTVDRISCPVCANSPLTRMVDNDQPHIWFESCPSCNGRFFDAGEFRDLNERSLGDLIRKFTAKGRPA
jgi:Zn-finger nucleic acid-binding protein